MNSLYIGVVAGTSKNNGSHKVNVTLLVAPTDNEAKGIVYTELASPDTDLNFSSMDVFAQNRLNVLYMVRQMNLTEDEILYISTGAK